MSQENVEVVRRAFAYVFYEGGDRAEAEAIFDPHVVMNPVEEAPLYGVDAIRQNFERWRDAWEELEVAVEEVIDAGDRVFLTAHHRGRGRRSGVEIDTRLYSVYTLRGGKILREDEYAERAEALEAAGLSEEAMSQENVELLRRMFDLFSKRELDWDALFELLGPDIVWEVRSDFPDAAVYTGHEGIRSLSDAFDEAVGETWYRPLEYIHIGSRVVVPLRWGGLGMGSGAAFAEREETWVFTLRGGRIRHVKEYGTKQDALDAVGLRD